MNVLRRALCTGLFLVAVPGVTALRAQSPVIPGDSLVLEQAIDFALDNQPLLRSASAAVQSASAGLTSAASSYYPSISASATAQRTDGVFVFNPSLPTRSQTYNNYTTGFQVQQMIFDFGKTIERVSAGKDFADASESDYQASRQTVIMNTEVAYFGVVQAQQVVQVNEEAVAQAAQHLKEAKAFYSVGKRAQADVTKAEVDLANANVGLITARNQLRIARVKLENAMGVHPPAEFRVRSTFDIVPFTLDMDSVKEITYAQRPELLAAQGRVAANRALASAAWDQHLPTLSATGNWSWSNFEFPNLYSRWTAGLTLSLPLFEGFGISAQVDQARATADQAQADLDALKESIRLEVEQNYLSLREAEERISATDKLVQQAEENLNLAEKQYTAGVGTALEVTDAQLTLSNARITRIQALSDYNTFLVQLQRSMGVLNR